MTMNRRNVASNPYQGKAKKVLTVCSAGCLRSPTAAEVLSREPFNFNTRSAGVDIYHAIVPVDPILIYWADEIVVMGPEMLTQLIREWPEDMNGKDVKVLNIPDRYAFRSPDLQQLIAERYRSEPTLTTTVEVEDALPVNRDPQ